MFRPSLTDQLRDLEEKLRESGCNNEASIVRATTVHRQTLNRVVRIVGFTGLMIGIMIGIVISEVLR